jgi:transcriptional regulator GlxA family with amidase domain
MNKSKDSINLIINAYISSQYNSEDVIKLLSINCTYVSTAVVYILKNFRRQTLSVYEVSNEVGRQGDYLERIFKKELNISIHLFVILCRIEQFKILYKNSTHLNFDILSEQSGFPSYKSFHKHIRNLYKLSPKKYLGKCLIKSD